MRLPDKLPPSLRKVVPNLTDDGHSVRSDRVDTYNCVAWAGGDAKRWGWPDAARRHYWPKRAPREETVGAFIAAFRSRHYRPCDDDRLVAGIEKVALFVHTPESAEFWSTGDLDAAEIPGTPSHMARQLESGAWTSKLGESYDIEHHELHALEGPGYGRLECILARPARKKRR